MYTDKEILEIIDQKITADEKLGEQAGGSGHLGFVSYQINYFKTRQISPQRLEIAYSYTVYVESEFTYYPDNPPKPYTHDKKIMVNRDKVIVG
ncbi:hypothetical protein JXQ31_12270 [candidate division KSB1 bacterium]|nr:hypothetical protein [candidate division KSB1 bacterium]